MNSCACAAALGMDSNCLKCSKFMTCMLSACATDYLSSWCFSCVYSTSGGPPPGHCCVQINCSHTACKHSPTHSWWVSELKHPPCHTVQQCVLIGSHTKMLAECLEAHVRWLGGQDTRASQQSSVAPRLCTRRAEHISLPLGWMTMSTDLPGLSRQRCELRVCYGAKCPQLSSQWLPAGSQLNSSSEKLASSFHSLAYRL